MSTTTTIPGSVPTVYPGSSNNNGCPSNYNPTGGTTSGNSTSGTYPNVSNTNTGSNGSSTDCYPNNNNSNGTTGTYPNVSNTNPGSSSSTDCCPTGNSGGSGSQGTYPTVPNTNPNKTTTTTTTTTAGGYTPPKKPSGNETTTSTTTVTNGKYPYIKTPSGRTTTTTINDGSGNGKVVTGPDDDYESMSGENGLNSSQSEDDFADPISVFSGAHTISVGLLSLNGGQNTSLVAHYNSGRLSKGNLGIGWYHDYEKHLEITNTLIKAYDTPSTYDEFVLSNDGFTYKCTAENKREYKIVRTGIDEYCLDCNYDRYEYYHSDGSLKKIVNHQGNVIEIDYHNERITIHDITAGKNIVLSKDYSGKVVEIIEYSLSGGDILQKVELEYLHSYLVNIKDVNGNSLTYSYNANGKIENGTDSNNVKYFENAYDEYGRVISQRDGVGSDATIFMYDGLTRKTINRNGDMSVRVYNDNGQLLEYTDENGNKKTYQYDSCGNTIKETDALGCSITKEYNIFNKPTKIIDKNGNITAYAYDEKGNLTSIKYPGITNSETFAYDSSNRIVKHVDLRGLITLYTYDENGMLASKSVKKGDNDPNPRTVQYTYANGLLMSETDVNGNETSYEYNALGQMIKKTDCLNNSTSYEYDLSGNVKKITYADGNFVTYAYDCNYQKISSTDANGNVTEYDYNGNMKNTSVKLPDNNEMGYLYDGEDRLIREVDQAGNCTEYTYDKAGRVISKKLPDGAVTKYVYDRIGNVVKETTPTGAAIIKTFDNKGNVLTAMVQDNDGDPYNDVITSYEYDSLDRVVKMTKQAYACVLNTTTYTYSPAGDVLSEIVIADGKVYSKSYTYDIYGNKLTEADANGNVTGYTYDVNNNLIKITDALGNVTTNTYDKLNRLIQVKNARGAIVKYGYDALGRKITVTDARKNKFTTIYDANGNVLKTLDPNGNVLNQSTFNCLNLPATVTDPAGGTTTYEYNAVGKPLAITDPLNNTKTFGYNSRGMNISVVEPTGTESTASYNSLGKLTKLCGPNGGQITYTYDSVGRLISETTTSNGTIAYEYNAHGVMSKITNARNQVKNISYDSIGRVTGYTCPEGTASFTYDKNGNVLTAADSKGTITRTYDALNRVLTYTDTFGKTISYEYDAVGNLVKLTYPDNTEVCYEYDLNNNLVKVTDWANRVTTYAYDCNNRVVEVVKPDGSTTANIYDDLQRLVSSITKSASGNIISGFEYTFDAMGRLSCDKNLAKNKEICYAYDTLSRVVLKKVIDLSDNSETSESFHYNPAGNICMANGNESYEYDANNRLLRCNGRYLGYDEDGNMFISELGNFTFDSSNRLIHDGVSNFSYNVEGNRVGLFSWTVQKAATYTYNTNTRLSQLLVAEINHVVTKYVYGLGLISEETGTDFKVYHYDYRGSTVALTDESGNVTDTYSYDTYGKMLEHEGTSTTQFLYNGRDGVMTEYSGLIYMRARYYSPTLRRFVNADKVHGDITNSLTLNRYSFCNGDPVNGVDPLGLSRESGDGTYINAPSPNVNYLPLDEYFDMIANSPEEIYREDMKALLATYFSVISSDELRSALYSWLNESIKASRPPKGVNTAKYNIQKLNDIDELNKLLGDTSTYAKFAKALPWICVAGTTVLNMNANVQNGADKKRVLSDAIVDVADGSLAIIAGDLGATLATAAVGATAGSAVPVAGTVAGFVGGLIGGAIYYVATSAYKNDGTSLSDKVKDYLYDHFDEFGDYKTWRVVVT